MTMGRSGICMGCSGEARTACSLCVGQGDRWSGGLLSTRSSHCKKGLTFGLRATSYSCQLRVERLRNIPPSYASNLQQWPRNYRSERSEHDEIPKRREQECKGGCRPRWSEEHTVIYVTIKGEAPDCSADSRRRVITSSGYGRPNGVWHARPNKERQEKQDSMEIQCTAVGIEKKRISVKQDPNQAYSQRYPLRLRGPLHFAS